MNVPVIRPIFNQIPVNRSQNITDTSILKSNTITGRSVSFCGLSGTEAVARLKKVVDSDGYTRGRIPIRFIRSNDSYANVARAADIVVTYENAPQVRKYLEMAFRKDEPNKDYMFSNLREALKEEAPDAFLILFPGEKLKEEPRGDQNEWDTAYGTFL